MHRVRAMIAGIAIAAGCCAGAKVVAKEASELLIILPAVQTTGLDEEILPQQPESIATETLAPVSLTLADLETLALANNPVLAKAQAEIEAVRGKWQQVGLRPNPVLGYLGSEIGNDGAAGQQGGFIEQEFVTADKLRLRRAVVSREIEQAAQRMVAHRLRVQTDVRSEYYNVLVAQQRVDVSRKIAQLADRAVQSIKQLLKAEQATRIALLQSEVEAESTRIELQTAQNLHQSAWRRLLAVCGTTDLVMMPLEGDVTSPPALAEWGTSLARLLAKSPELSTAMLGIDRARWNLRRACAEARPNVQASLGVQYDDSTDDTISSVQVSMPLPIYNRNQGGIRQAQGELTAARRDADRVELNLQQRLASTYGQLASAQARAARYRDSLLPKAEETLRLVTKGYQAGELPYLNLLTSQRTFFQTNLQYLDALQEAWTAHVQIEGLLLSGSLTGR